MKLIVALGNPGAEYAGSRHNAGWRVADILAVDWAPPVIEGPVTVARGKIADEEVWVVKPQTYMNRSGMAFAEWLDDRPEVEDEISRLLESRTSAEADEENRLPLDPGQPHAGESVR